MSTTSPAGRLVELAARKQLPHHQYTDPATVRWITVNRPDFPDGPPPPTLRPHPQGLVTRAAIPGDWLAEAKCHDSLHGVRHAMRTAALAALLAEARGLSDNDTATLVLAAAVHDCRRLHDKDDRGHGARAAIWLTGNADTVWSHFGLTPTPSRIAAAGTAVRLHDVPYEHFSPDDHTDHRRAETISDLLKAADALDRYRLPKLTWWPDPAQVRCEAFDDLRATAFELVIRSESAWLAGASSADAVFTGLAQLELIS
ncbi:hypothetical protein BX286_2552 [Streptomyces sp. 3211.6]|uniref:hypothetical protein n=1 Tax=Streptomyces TaxID=1883 RepID=UPI0009A47CCA|nr:MULTISPECIES: hypothetical protein [Streptomyces]RKT04592.1 hypothetical protein BX286_2552 [Streptomyces sp. 3211.6]RPF40467.1 hypothetical protein EDD96_4228 [Streptomyces sp. Ag109_G2-6]